MTSQKSKMGGVLPQADVWCFGSPCFVAGTAVQTNTGIKNIEDVKVGDKVVTIDGSYQKVTATMCKYSNDLYHLKVEGELETVVTSNHPYWVRKRRERHVGHTYDEPKWLSVKDIKNGDLVMSCHYENVPGSKSITDEEAWLLGRYVADGYINNSHRKGRNNSYRHQTIFCIGTSKTNYFRKHLMSYHANESTTSNKNGSVTKFTVNNERLMSLAMEFKRGAINKEIAPWVFALPIEQRKLFIDGYLSGDGYLNKENRWHATTISRNLAVSFARLVENTLQVPASVTYVSRKRKKHKIENRIVNEHSQYIVQFANKIGKTTYYHSKLFDDVLWKPVRNVEKDKNATYVPVYNLEVEKNHTYNANGIIVHNCTNISLAGNREGIHGEASSMFFEVMRLLNDRQEIRKPSYLFMENVKNLLSSNGGRDFAEVLLQMDKAGYDVEWQVCNSKEVVPQNRERIFIVGHKRGRTTRRVFPLDIKPYATQYRILSDVLEDNVDEKYYLSDDKVKQLVVNAQKDDFKKKSSKATVNVVGSTKYDWQTTLGYRERVYGNGKISALTATDYKQPKRIAEKDGKLVERADQVKQVGNTVKTNSFGGNPQRGRVYDDKGLAPTLNTMQGGGLEPKILVKNATKQGYLEDKYGDGVDLAYPNLNTRRGRVQKGRSNTLTVNPNQGVIDQRKVINPLKGKTDKSWQFEQQVYDKNGITRTVKANGGSGNIPKVVENEEVYPCLTPDRVNKRQNGRRFKNNEDPMFTVTAADRHGIAIKNPAITQELRIRKLTPLECWRLQGFSDEQFHKAQDAGVSNSQLYKQAGNAVTVPVIHAIADQFEIKD